MTEEYWVLGFMAILAGAFFWFGHDFMGYFTGAGMTAYACRDVFKSPD